jgi:DNA ligase-1
VNTLFDLFLKIAHETGEGSQDRKLNLIADLLRSLTPIEAKYAVRILLKTLRLGFSDKTVLDALSILVAGDKSARVALEAAYNVRPDVGWLAKLVQSSKFRVQRLSRVSPEIGTPVLPALCQRLPSTEEIVEKMHDVAIEPKWDGQRIQAHVWREARGARREVDHPPRAIRHVPSATCHVQLFTRSLEDVTDMFPDLVASLRSLITNHQSLITNFILDGEIVGIDPKTGKTLPFQTMITRKRKYGVEAQLKSVPIRYMIFDVLFLNGKSLLSEPFSSRRKILDRLFSYQEPGTRPSSRAQTEGHQQLTLAPQVITDDPTTIRHFLKRQIAAGLEGIVTKKWNSPYSPGRTGFHWVKLKWEGGAKAGGLLDTIDCVIMGTYAGRGKRVGFGVGAFLVGIVADGTEHLADSGKQSSVINHPPSANSYVTVSKIGTGLSDEQWKELQAISEKRKAESQPKEYDVPKALIPDRWLQPSIVVEIQADNITKSPLHAAGYALRFPRLVRYRTDKNPDQATTAEEIKRLFKLQKG